MNISLGGRPISKVALAIGSSLLAVLVVAILELGAGVLTMDRDAWIAFLFATLGPPALAFAKKLNTPDIAQILDAVPDDALVRYTEGRLAAVFPEQKPTSISELVDRTPPSPPTTRHESPY